MHKHIKKDIFSMGYTNTITGQSLAENFNYESSTW